MKSAFVGALLAAAVVVAVIFAFGLNVGTLETSADGAAQDRVEAPKKPTGTATN